MKTVSVKKISENAVVPSYGSPSAAGADLYACLEDEIVIRAGETYLVPTGISLSIPEGYAGFIFARSGLATKSGLAPANKVGVIDSDYRGEIFVALHNHSAEDRTILPKERIAQLVIMPVFQAEFVEAQSLDDTQRGAGGFGSTGKM